MLYCCETCGKKFTKEEEALGCEQAHINRQKKLDELEKLKNEKFKELQNDYKALNEKYQQYIKDYGVIPKLYGCYLTPLEKIFEMF